MKKQFLIILAVFALGCKKDEVSSPTASFTVTGRDATGNLITIEEGVAATVNNRAVTIKYTGTPSDFKVIYTGDASRVYIADPNKPPAGITTPQSGVNLGDSLTYTYSAAGTYPITVVATNIGDKGKVMNRTVATKTIILR